MSGADAITWLRNLRRVTKKPARCWCAASSRKCCSRNQECTKMPASANTTATLEVGGELPPLKKTISQRQIDCYSGVRPNSIHTDVEWAKKKGFPAPLAQALMSTAYVSQMMVQWLGTGFVRGGKISASFIKPVIVGDTL